MIFALPLFSTLSTASSNAMAIASIWVDDKKGASVLATGAVLFEAGGGAALALGAICPPQFVGLALVGAYYLRHSSN